MKKLAAVLLALSLLTICLPTYGEGEGQTQAETGTQSASVLITTEAQNDSVTTDVPEEDAGETTVAGEWSFPVTLTELQSDHSLLVNRDNLLASDYVPDDLIYVTVRRASSSKVELREEVNEALAKMFEAASAVTEYTYQVQNSKDEWVEKEFSSEEGLKLVLKSGYRSYGTQKTTYANYLARNNGVDDGISSPPGASEHQTGMACDILSYEYNANNKYMNDSFYQTPEAQWMEENCYSYGFILRYPEDQEAITQVPYEPWHLRYVGREIAGYIKNHGLTLEEFTEIWQAELADFVAAGGDIEAQLMLEATHREAGIESTVLEEYGEDGDAEISLSF